MTAPTAITKIPEAPEYAVGRAAATTVAKAKISGDSFKAVQIKTHRSESGALEQHADQT